MRQVQQIFAIFIFLLVNSSCDNAVSNGKDKYTKYAQTAFINECSCMSEREANSKEIDYWRAPQITETQFLYSYTGKDLVHLCNQIEEKNQYDIEHPIHFGPTTYSITYRVDNIKEYALDNMGKTIAYQYRFSGIFTNFSRESKYSEHTFNVLVVPRLGKIIIFSDRGANGYWYVRGISDFEMPWYEKI